jgi:hypothetical protein
MMAIDPIELLTDSLALAEAQLEAAKTMDVEALRDATAARQDLLFELQHAGTDALRDDPRLLPLLREHREIDDRLEAVLQSAVTALRGALDPGSAGTTYLADGRIRGGRP